MAEALALSSGIASLLTLVNSVTKASCGYVHNVRKASEHIQAFLSELSALESVLVELNALARDSKYQRTWTQRGYLAFTIDGINKCRHELEEVYKKMEYGSKGQHVWNRLRWPFTMGETRKLVDTFHRYQGTFHASLSIQAL